jgi:hypothetical protein
MQLKTKKIKTQNFFNRGGEMVSPKLKWTFWGMVFTLAATCPTFGQVSGKDSVLPPDHLLENLPWMGDDGKIESKGLFDFEDVRGIGQKDLILIYRTSAPLNELDKNHTQTFALCFYDAAQKKYVKRFEDEGGVIQWVKLLKNRKTPSPFLVFLRDDLRGGRNLKAFAYFGGKMKQVLEASASQMFVNFSVEARGTEIWWSSKDTPKKKNDAERAYAWSAAKAQFEEVKISEEVALAHGVTLPPVPVKKEPSKASVSEQADWWDKPFDAQVAFGVLKNEIVPDSIKNGNIIVLGKKATAFFTEAQNHGIRGKEFVAMRAEYYAGVAQSLEDAGRSKEAAYYLDIALKLQPDNPSALALKAKLNR